MTWDFCKKNAFGFSFSLLNTANISMELPGPQHICQYVEHERKSVQTVLNWQGLEKKKLPTNLATKVFILIKSLD